MELITDKILNNTKEFYKLKEYPIFHQAISLIISQKITFNKGREIRKKLFELTKESCFTKDNLGLLSYDQFKNIGLDDDKIKVIMNVIDIDCNDEEDFIVKISKTKGIGPWTIKSLKIMFDLDDEFLFEDLWIRKRVSELFKKDNIMSQMECKNISDAIENKRIMSLFFWKIKPEGIKKILENEELKREDFV